MEIIKIETSAHEEMIDISALVEGAVRNSGIDEGICCIYTPHTTAAITINENADPAVKSDIVKGMRSLNLESISFGHMEGNSPAHIKSSIFGCSEFVIIEKGKPQLGMWQGIYFCEFDGPRSRKAYVKVM